MLKRPKQGLARLAELEHARIKREGARCIRARLGAYSTEYEEIQRGYRAARQLEREADKIEGYRRR